MLAEDPHLVDAGKINHIAIVQTVVGGQVMYAG
jgi:hypothetical protein